MLKYVRAKFILIFSYTYECIFQLSWNLEHIKGLLKHSTNFG